MSVDRWPLLVFSHRDVGIDSLFHTSFLFKSGVASVKTRRGTGHPRRRVYYQRTPLALVSSVLCQAGVSSVLAVTTSVSLLSHSHLGLDGRRGRKDVHKGICRRSPHRLGRDCLDRRNQRGILRCPDSQGHARAPEPVDFASPLKVCNVDSSLMSFCYRSHNLKVPDLSLDVNRNVKEFEKLFQAITEDVCSWRVT